MATDDDLEARVAYLTAVVERIHDGLWWFLDPPANEDELPERLRRPQAAPPERDRSREYGDPVRLKKVCPKAWKMGRDARELDQPMASNPYHDTRGGYRNSWFNGWMERDRELEAQPPDA